MNSERIIRGETEPVVGGYGRLPNRMSSERCPCCGKRWDGKPRHVVASEQREAIERFLLGSDDEQ